MKMRIALSLVAGLLLAGTAFADPEPLPGDNGIGTSPSYDLMCVAPPAPCGIWIDVDEDTADARARAGGAPDAIVFVQGHTTCNDAVTIAGELWPGASVVFEVEQGWRAKVAAQHPPAVAPAMMEWRAPAPPTMRAPLQAGVPWGVLLEVLSPLITAVVAKLFHSAVKDTSRQAELLSYANTAFQVVEALGPTYGLGSNAKYSRYIEQILDALKAAGRPEPTAAEMEQLKQLARDKSILAKPAPRAFPLPPPPPRG
jgi:hypothetical protein